MAWGGTHYDRLMVLFVVSFAVGCTGGLLLSHDVIENDHYDAIITEAAGRDMCMLVDGNGKAVDRTFVHAGEQCPDPGGGHTVNRTANGDLPTAPLDDGRVALLAAMVLFGFPTCIVAVWKSRA